MARLLAARELVVYKFSSYVNPPSAARDSYLPRPLFPRIRPEKSNFNRARASSPEVSHDNDGNSPSSVISRECVS